MQAWEVYEFTSDGLIVVTAIPAIVLAICSLCLVRHRTDPARFCFTLLNITFCLFAVFCLLQCTALMLSTAYHQVYNYYSTPSEDSTTAVATLSAQIYLSALANLFDTMTEISIYVTLVVLSTDILVVYGAGKPPKSDRLCGLAFDFSMERAFKLTSYVIAGVLSLLAVTEAAIILGLDARIIADGQAYGTFLNYDDGLYDRYVQVNAAIIVMSLILAFYMTFRAIMIKAKCRPEPRVKAASTYLVVCSVLWLLRAVYNMIYIKVFVSDNNGQKDYNWNPFTTVTNLAFSTWPAFIILTILFALGVKKRKGLWTRNDHDSIMADKVGSPSTDHDIEMSPIETHATTRSSVTPGQPELQAAEQISPAPAQTETQPAELPSSARQSAEQSPLPPIPAALSTPQSNDQSPFPMAHPSTQGLTPQQTPWGYGYFVPQDPSQPIQQVSQASQLQRRPIPTTWPSQRSQETQPDFDYRTQPPPEYEQHIYHLRPQLAHQPDHIVLAEEDVEALGLDYQADGRPPADGDASQYPPKK